MEARQETRIVAFAHGDFLPFSDTRAEELRGLFRAGHGVDADPAYEPLYLGQKQDKSKAHVYAVRIRENAADMLSQKPDVTVLGPQEPLTLARQFEILAYPRWDALMINLVRMPPHGKNHDAELLAMVKKELGDDARFLKPGGAIKRIGMYQHLTDKDTINGHAVTVEMDIDQTRRLQKKYPGRLIKDSEIGKETSVASLLERFGKDKGYDASLEVEKPSVQRAHKKAGSLPAPTRPSVRVKPPEPPPSQVRLSRQPPSGRSFSRLSYIGEGRKTFASPGEALAFARADLLERFADAGLTAAHLMPDSAPKCTILSGDRFVVEACVASGMCALLGNRPEIEDISPIRQKTLKMSK